MAKTTTAVRFVRDYTVNNGTGNPPGPFFKQGETYVLPCDQAEFWARAGHAVPATVEEAAKPSPVVVPVLTLGQPAGPAAAPDLDAMRSADLITLAEKEGVDLGNATKKSEIVDRIKAHRAAKDPAGTPPPPITAPAASIQPPPGAPAAPAPKTT